MSVRRFALLLVGALLPGLALTPLGAAPALAAPSAGQCAQAGTALAATPWAQQRLAPESIWPVADGSNVKVAVLASGVDAGAPQLAGRVGAGRDYLSVRRRNIADRDCEGLGTQVAGVIAAAASSTVGFHGLAPKATIVPYRVATSAVIDSGRGAASGTARLATALRVAVAARPAVIVVPVVTYQDDPALRSAVAQAVAANIVVVAAVGEVRKDSAGPSVPYPAAYPGVLGVGAVDQDGALGTDSAVLSVVRLVAPGEDLLSTQRGGGLVAVSGTAIAAGYVAGVAALIRSRWTLEPATEVIRRLLVTATPLAGTTGYGAGLVNPVQAVTETLSTAAPRPLPTALGPARDPRADSAGWHRSSTIALGMAALLAVLGALVAVFAMALPRGRRRRWRPGIAGRPQEYPEDDLPSPPVLLFEDRQ